MHIIWQYAFLNMAQTFIARVNKINAGKKRLILTIEQLAALTQPSMSVHELELILGKQDTIHRDEQAILSIEKALQKASETRQQVVETMRAAKDW